MVGEESAQTYEIEMNEIVPVTKFGRTSTEEEVEVRLLHYKTFVFINNCNVFMLKM